MRISVIVPIYNVEGYLQRCVDSILNQTYRDFELILVDDGSSDNCAAICDEYSRLDSRVYVIHRENSGVSAARNAGIDWAFANSDSQWLSFVDSDDWVHPQMLEALIDAARQTELPVSIASFKRVGTECEAESVAWNKQCAEIWSTEEFFCRKNVEATVAWGKLYSKHLFANLRYPVGRIHEDDFLTYKVLFQTQQIAYIPSPMYCYFQNTSGITLAKWHLKKLDKVQAFCEQMDWFEKEGYNLAYRTRLASYAWIIGESIKSLSESGIPNRNIHIKQLKRQLRTMLREKRDLLSPSDVKTKWIYQIAYPTEMKIRRFFRRKADAFQTLGIKGVMARLIGK